MSSTLKNLGVITDEDINAPLAEMERKLASDVPEELSDDEISALESQEMPDELDDTQMSDYLKAFGVGALEGINPVAFQQSAEFSAGTPELSLQVAKPEIASSQLAGIEKMQPEVQESIGQAEANISGIKEKAPLTAFAGNIAGSLVPSPINAASDAALVGLGSKLKEYGKTKAYLATRPFKKFTQQIKPDQEKRIGETLLKEKIVTGFPTSKETMLTKVDNVLSNTGKELDDVIETLAKHEDKLRFDGLGDQALTTQGAIIKGNKVGVSTDLIGSKVLDELAPHPGSPDYKEISEFLIKQVDAFKANNPEFIPLQEAETLKRYLSKEIPWNKIKKEGVESLTDRQKIYLQLHDGLKSGVEDAAEFLASHTNSPISADKFKSLKNKYGDLKMAEKILKSSQASEKANWPIGLMELISGTGAASTAAKMGTDATTAAIAATALAGGTWFGKKYGSQIISKGAYEAGKILSRPASEFGKFRPLVELAKTLPKATANKMIGDLSVNPEFKNIVDSNQALNAIEIDPTDIEQIKRDINKKVTDPVMKAKMLDRLNRKGELIHWEQIEQ